MQLIKTPPPTLLRARFATVLVYLPSVPSVVLPIIEPGPQAGLVLLLNPDNYRPAITGSFRSFNLKRRERFYITAISTLTDS
jgi:hypothetical protein